MDNCRNCFEMCHELRKKSVAKSWKEEEEEEEEDGVGRGRRIEEKDH